MHEFILQFFTHFMENYRCCLCGKVFRFSGDHRYLDTHLRNGHKLSERQIVDGPKTKTFDEIIASQRMTQDQLLHRRRCQNGKGNSSLPSVVSTPTPIQTINDNNADNQQVIQKFYQQIPNGYSCTLCDRKFIKKSDHILVCHISMAHPSLRAEDSIIKPKLPLATAVTLPHDENEPDISQYFNRFNSRLQCVLCKLLFGNSKHCLSHMKLKHYETYCKLPLVERKVRRKDLLTEREKQEKLKALNYDPNAPSMMTQVNYNDTDEDNIMCDFFEPLDDKMQCLICDFMIKTKSASFLLKHLRTSHSIFNVDKKTKKIMFDGPATKRPRLMEADKQPYDLFDNYETPSLSENDSDFVWNFFTLNGDKITCMCCGLEFVRKTYSSLVKHLQLMHPSVYSPMMEREKSPDLPEPLSITMRRKMTDPLRKPKSFKSERLLTKFLVSHGVSYEVTEDPNLHHIQRALNKVTSLDNATIMDGIIEDCVQDSQLYMKILRESPITISASFHCDAKEVFIAFALHHFDENLERSNNVVLRKLKGSKLTAKTVKNLVEELGAEQHFSMNRIASIVVEDKHSSLFDSYKNSKKFSSFHKSIDDFARAVIKIAQFDKALNSFNQIMEAIMNDDDMLAKLELLIKATGNKFDVTLTKSTTWYHCLEMLSMIVEDDKNFQLISTFSRRWLPALWLNEESIAHLSILVRLLKEINTFVRIASYEDGTISSAVPLILEIITNITSKPLPIPISAALNTLIDCHLRIFLDCKGINYYSIAMFLDPRYVNSDQIYASHEWAGIEQKVKKLIMEEDVEYAKAANPTLPDSMGAYSREVSRELVVYHNLVNSNRPGLQASDCSLWWMRQKNKIPIIARKAREFFCTPTCTLDASYFFGKGGKFAFLNATMGYRQFCNSMIIASEQEVFKGRGYFASSVAKPEREASPSTSEPKDCSPSTSEKAPPLPAKIAGFACIRNQQQEEDKFARLRKQHMTLMKQPLNTDRFIRRNLDNEDDLEEFLMLPPPPVLEQMVDTLTPVDSSMDSEGFCKIDLDDIKQEVEDIVEEKPQYDQLMIKTEIKTEEPDV